MAQYRVSDCSNNVCVPQEGNTGCQPCSDEAQQLMRANSKSNSFRMDFQLPDDTGVLSSDQGKRVQGRVQQNERIQPAQQVPSEQLQPLELLPTSPPSQVQSQRFDRSQPQIDRTQNTDATDCELSGGCQPRGGMPRVGVNIGYGPSYPDYFPQRWNSPQNNVGQQMLHSLLYSAMRTQFNDHRYDQIFNPGRHDYDPRFQPGRYDPRYQPGWDQTWDQSYDQRFDPRYQPGYQPGYDPRYQPGYDPRYQPGYDPRYQPGYDRVQRYDPRWDQAYDQRFQPGCDPRFQPGCDTRFQPGRYDPRYQPGLDQYDPRYQPGLNIRQPHYPQQYYPGGGGCFPGGGGGFYPGGFRPGCNNNNIGQQILFNAVLPMIMNQIGRNNYRNFHHGGGRFYR